MIEPKKPKTLADDMLAMARKARDKVHDGRFDPIGILRTCFTLAVTLDLTGDCVWISYELFGYPKHSDKGEEVILPAYRTVQLNSSPFGSFRTERYEIRENLQDLLVYVKRGMKQTISTGYFGDRWTINSSNYERVIGSVANRCLIFLDYVVTELQYGDTIASLTDGIRKQTDEKLANLGDEMVNEIKSLADSLASENPADWSKVGHSCRRMLEILADKVFPARDQPYLGKDGRRHPVGPEQYINRIVCFVDQRSTGSQRRLLTAEVEFLASYLDCLKIVACAIEHTIPSEKYHVDMAAIRTYLMVSELLKLLEAAPLSESRESKTPQL